MTALLLRRSLSLKETRDRFLALSMAVSFQDALASTGPHFVEVLRGRLSRIGNEFGAISYLRSSTDTVVRVGESTSRSTHNLQYTANVPFIKKYSVLFELGEQFEWKKAGDSEDWLSSIVNARPRFIKPFYLLVVSADTKQLKLVQTHSSVGHHCCWFVEVVQIRENMTVTILEEFVPYIFAPPDAVVIIHSGARFFHVKLKNDELIDFGHLQFDLFVFDEEGCEISYDWSTTLPIHQANAPMGWDAELAMSNANACNWFVRYVGGHFVGYGWKLFVDEHKLESCDMLVLSPDINLQLHTMVFSVNDYSLTSEGSVASLLVLLSLSVVMSGGGKWNTGGSYHPETMPDLASLPVSSQMSVHLNTVLEVLSECLNKSKAKKGS
ncbi:hypothetical protein RHSIM_RhsimUnG0029800 [Rhododendron simsii]|uniref:Uncharacterized protein n=1 Tax=Rhododendron simsii TaxID=118357 RepID=A0A834L5N8_RHOSS|nr:hypothetical protein RHSIM_RhsimUnG0029800 [Rhododendron simsii]